MDVYGIYAQCCQSHVYSMLVDQEKLEQSDNQNQTQVDLIQNLQVSVQALGEQNFEVSLEDLKQMTDEKEAVRRVEQNYE